HEADFAHNCEVIHLLRELETPSPAIHHFGRGGNVLCACENCVKSCGRITHFLSRVIYAGRPATNPKKLVACAKHICLHMCMPIASNPPPLKRGVKTGRRENPAINGPRDRTVCFMLSEPEKDSVDRLAFCMHLTRSGILANIVAEFVAA